MRVDALSTWGVSSEDTGNEPTEEEKSEVGRTGRLNIERRLRALEGKPLKSLGNANQTPLAATKKFDIKEARKYNPDADGLTGDEPAAQKSKTEVNGTTPKKSLVQEVESEEESESESESEEEEAPKAGKADKAAKKAEKEAKKARKAERAAKREAKAAKKAAKEAKKAEKDGKKRKREDGEEKADKKKKKSKA